MSLDKTTEKQTNATKKQTMVIKKRKTNNKKKKYLKQMKNVIIRWQILYLYPQNN